MWQGTHRFLLHCVQAVQLSGKSQFPFMVDPNSGQQMGESDDIIEYLYNEYGDGNIPLLLKLGPLTAISNGLALLPRYRIMHQKQLQTEATRAYCTCTAL